MTANITNGSVCRCSREQKRGCSPGKDLGGCRGGTLVLEHVVYVTADEHRLVRLRELDAAEPRAAQQRTHPTGVGQGERSTRPRHLAEAEYRRGLGEPDGKEEVLLAGAPANERQPAAAPQRLPQVGERRRRVLAEGPAVPQWQNARRAMSSAGQSSQIRPHPPWTA